MDYKDFLFEKKSLIIPMAGFLKLQQKYVRDEKSLHVFTENADDYEFYRHAILSIYRGYKVEPYYMEGKKNVVDLFKEVQTSKYNSSRLLFFVDKDYDDILKIPMIRERNFFYTKYYSIENYLVSIDILDIILDRFFTQMTDALKEKIKHLYEEAYLHFVKQMKVFTKFILIDRESVKRAELDEFKLVNFIHFDSMVYMYKKLINDHNYDRIIRNSKSTKLEKNLLRNKTIIQILVEKCNYDSSIITFKRLEQKYKLIESIQDPKVYIRGKFELWFFTEILKTADHAIKKIFEEDSEISATHKAAPRKRTGIDNDNIFDLICPKMSIPRDVAEFVTLNYNYLNGHS